MALIFFFVDIAACPLSRDLVTEAQGVAALYVRAADAHGQPPCAAVAASPRLCPFCAVVLAAAASASWPAKANDAPAVHKAHGAARWTSQGER